MRLEGVVDAGEREGLREEPLDPHRPGREQPDRFRELVLVDHRADDAQLAPGLRIQFVDETRLLERALGSADKLIVGNEQDTQVVQRRCLPVKIPAQHA